ncbi:MAG: porin [Pseudomonadota bacterium]
MAEPKVAAAVFEPPPPVPNCSSKKGYFIVPNTTSCMKILGMIRAQGLIHENNVAADSWSSEMSGAIQTTTQSNDTWSMGTALRFGADVVQETDYGTLRGNVMLQADPGTDGSGGPAGIRYAFVTFGGFTAGHTNTFFAPDGALGGYGGAVGDYDTRRSLFAYTAKFTDEVSASIAIEDHDATDGSDGVGGSGPTAANAGIALAPGPSHILNDSTQLPDLVGNVVGKFDWGLLFASGAIGQFRSRDDVTHIPYNYAGYALGLGGNVKLDGLAKGDALQAKVGFADGLGGLIGSSDDHAVFDTVGPDIGTYTTSGYTVQGSFVHNWSPTWSSTAYGGYAGADRSASTDPTVAALLNDKVVTAWNLGANVQWSPVENYTIGGELFYGSATRENNITGDYTADAIGSIVRVQRDF